MSRRSHTPGWNRLTVFLTAQAVIVTVGAAWAASSAMRQETAPTLSTLRTEPWVVAPQYDAPLVVSDDQLRDTLRRLLPRFRDKQPPISSVDHALRFWGLEAQFDDPQALSGREMQRLLVDHKRFAEIYGEDAKPLLEDAEHGVRYRTQQGELTSSHYDHTLACLAEVGTPLTYPVRTDTRKTTLRSVLDQAFQDFSLNQAEYEWSAMAFAMYSQSPQDWMTKDRQWVNFDIIADRIMRQRLPEGVCRAQHRLHALVLLLRIDDQQQLLTPEARERIIHYLQEVTQLLVSTQSPEGFWETDWTQPPPKDEAAADALSWRLLVTGHVLEWWALAPAEVLPPRENIIRAGQWTVAAIAALEDEEIIKRYGPLSHAGRALALWRKKWPHQVDLSTNDLAAETDPGETKP